MSALGSRFPRCELHGRRLVDALPPNCPHGMDDPFITAILPWQDQGYALLAPGPDQRLAEGLALFARAETCGACLRKRSADPHIRFLASRAVRERIEFAEQRSEERTAEKPTITISPHVQRLIRRRKAS